MTTTSPLNESGHITLDGSGNGKLQMTPWGGAVTWLPATISVKCSSNTAEASAKIYIGPTAIDQYFVDGTLSGSTGDSTGRVSGYSIDTHGSSLWVVWAGGDAGAIATAQINGTMVTP